MNNNFSAYFSNATNDDGVLTNLFSGNLRAELSSDNIIPDTVADIEKVLISTAMPKIEGYYLGDHTIEIEGSMTYQVLLLTEGNHLTSLSFTEPFELKQEVTGLSQNCRVILLPTLDYVTARLVNPRKLNLRSQTNVLVKILCPIPAKPTITGTESLDDDMNLQRSYTTISSADTEWIEEKQIAVSQDMELDSKDPAAAEIIHCSIQLHPAEVRFKGEDANVIIHAIVSLIYRTEEDNYFTAEKKFVLEKSLSLPHVENAEWLATAVPGEISAEIASNSYGEMKIIELDFPYHLTLTTIRNKTMEAVSDMYSTEYECETDFCTLSVTKLHRLYSTNLSVNAVASREELGGNTVRGIFTGNVVLKAVETSYNKEKNKILVEGLADIALVGDNHADEGSDPPFSTMTWQYPFRCELDAGEDIANGEFILDCQVSATKYRIDSVNIYADLELSIRILALETVSLPYLAALHLDHGAPIQRSTAPITLCYPSGKETLWDIAKYYKITEDSIILSNGMTNESLSDRKVLLIPRSQPKRAVFSKVI